MNAYRSSTWTLIVAGYGVGITGIFVLTPDVPLLESILIAALLPASATVIYMSTRRILARDSSNLTNISLATTYDRILFDVVLFVVALHMLIVAALGGVFPAGSWLPRAPIILFGLLGICVGNLLPRTRPNLAIGIRTPRTLADRDVWINTHRRAGYLAVVFGLLFVVCGALLSKPHVELVLGTVSLVSTVLLASEHLRTRRA